MNNPFELCQNNPEFISKLADRIMSGEKIIINYGRRSGKSNFNLNLTEELKKRLNNNE